MPLIKRKGPRNVNTQLSLQPDPNASSRLRRLFRAIFNDDSQDYARGGLPRVLVQSESNSSENGFGEGDQLGLTILYSPKGKPGSTPDFDVEYWKFSASTAIRD